MSTSSTSGNSDTLIPLPTLIDLIKSNARALYGRHLTYDVVTSMTKRPVNMPAPAKYDGQKVHALLIGYAGEADVQGKLLRGAFTVGVGKTPPTVGYAVKLLYDETRVDVDGVIERLVRERDFEGGLMQEGDVDDEIDGATLRGD